MLDKRNRVFFSFATALSLLSVLTTVAAFAPLFNNRQFFAPTALVENISSRQIESLPRQPNQKGLFLQIPVSNIMSSSDEYEPESKKVKRSKKDEDEDDESEEEGKEGEAKVNDDGEAYFDLSKNKRCTVRKWKNMVMVDIREFYEKNGQQLPGKKGISLSTDQFEALSKIIKDGSLDKQIKKLKK